jgi:NTP pyrophosphatase (non-canonical NTP hydrolase)
MTPNEYQYLANRTASKYRATHSDPATEKKLALLGWTLGLGGETGEVLECVKKWQFHGKDATGLISELGDVLWYVSAICSELTIDLESVMKYNIDKLEERHQISE